eukprot:1533325-Alexandrium_andersonii.AAC.1
MPVGAATATQTLLGPAPLEAVPLLALAFPLGAASRRGRRNRGRVTSLALRLVTLSLALLPLRLATARVVARSCSLRRSVAVVGHPLQ